MKKYRTRDIGIQFLSAVLILPCFLSIAYSQDVPATHQKYIFFPYPMDRQWRSSLGLTLTTLPQDITEEQHYRYPAIDYHVLKKVSKNVYLDGRVNVQVFQNLITAGIRWATPLHNRLSLSLGNDIGWWFGSINIYGFNTRGNGFQNFPNASLGYRFNKKLLLTAKGEAIMNLSVNASTGNIPVASNYRLLSGSAFTIALEQPFFAHNSLTLGFRAIYTDFFWQTWSLFEIFDRNIFYPQLIIGVTL